ncbi:Uncharacterised protein [Yersinia bercovieri]|nr:Uncharacterised protein [Yersinia bercovieri]
MDILHLQTYTSYLYIFQWVMKIGFRAIAFINNQVVAGRAIFNGDFRFGVESGGANVFKVQHIRRDASTKY